MFASFNVAVKNENMMGEKGEDREDLLAEERVEEEDEVEEAVEEEEVVEEEAVVEGVEGVEGVVVALMIQLWYGQKARLNPMILQNK